MESYDMAVKSRGKRALALIKGAYRKYEEDAFPFGQRIEHPYDMMTDAMEHCTPEVKTWWREELIRRGINMQEARGDD